MPISFSDILGTAPGATYPAVDATNQSVKGFAYFTNLAEAQSTAALYQKIQGFVAITTQGGENETPAIFQYLGADASNWENDQFWVVLTTSEVTNTTPVERVTYLDTMSLAFNPFGKYDATVQAFHRSNFGLIPDEFELIPISANSATIYDVFSVDPGSATPTVGSNTWSNTWLNAGGAFSGFADDTPLVNISFQGSLKVGYQALVSDYNGFNATDEAAVEALNWSDPTNLEVIDYLKTIPEAKRPYAYIVHMPVNSAVEDELYIGYTGTANGFGDAAWTNPNNWTLLTDAGTNIASYRIEMSSASNSQSGSTLSINSMFPTIPSLIWSSPLTITDYVADMLSEIKLMLKFNSLTKTFLENRLGDPNSPFGKEQGDDLVFTLKTKVVS